MEATIKQELNNSEKLEISHQLTKLLNVKHVLEVNHLLPSH